MGKRAHPPNILAWWQRASSPLAAALRRQRPGPPAIALIVAEALAALIVLAALVWSTGDGDQTAAVTQPSASVRATPYLTAAPPATPTETETPTPLDPARIFDNLPPPLVEERIPVSPFDSPRLDGGIYHLSIDGTELVRIANEVPVPGPYASFSRSTLSPDGRWLAFVPDTPPVSQATSQFIYLKDLASQDPARAVAGFYRVAELAISPDGQKLIVRGSTEEEYGSDSHLLNLNERTVKALPQIGFAQKVRWSPTGEQIAFHKALETESFLYIADGQAENLKQLAPARDSVFVWSPDGSVLAVAQCCDSGDDGIYLFHPDGEKRFLTNAVPDRDTPEPSELAWSPDGTRLAFHVRAPQGDGFFMAVADVQTGSVVIHGPGQSPVWQRDGSRLAFVLDGKLYLARPDARDQWAVINPEQPFITSIAFSVNDSGILFNYQITPLRSIWRMSPSGEDQQFLAYGDSPVWSPDGSLIAFIGKVRSVTNDFGTGEEGENDVWVMNADGSDPHKVGEYRWSASRLYGAAQEGCARGLAWSADGTQVIFDGPSERSAAPADGSASAVETVVGCGPGPTPTGNGSITEPASDLSSDDPAIVHDATGAEILRLPGRGTQWSPEGGRIAYWTTDVGAVSTSYLVHVVEYPSGRELARGGYAHWDEQLPELFWSPDGERIAYARGINLLNSEIFVLNVDDPESSYQLSPGSDPTWSPDALRIAFSFADSTDGPGVYVTEAVYGARKERITDGLTPSWSPDGSLILFTR
jgi:Tol biopolymer transport system component